MLRQFVPEQILVDILRQLIPCIVVASLVSAPVGGMVKAVVDTHAVKIIKAERLVFERRYIRLVYLYLLVSPHYFFRS